MMYHPDRNQGDKGAEAKFKELNEAYDVLKDAEKRAAYDRFGHAAFEGGMGGGAGGGPQGGFGGAFEDIFEEMFGGLGRRGGGRGGPVGRGSDLRTAVEVTLEEAFAGAKKTIRIATAVVCEACKGSGADGPAAQAAATCGTCGGSGKVRAQQGFFLIERTCPTCGGAGRVVKNPCKVCAGQGRVQRDRTLSVSVPAGVEDGTRIRLTGEGEAGLRGAPAGDLYVDVSLKSHPIFQRDGANIFVRVPLRMTQAALGAAVEVPTVDGGRAKVTIPAGTQAGDQFRLRGKGFSVLRSANRGDLYIQVAVETPRNLSKRQQEFLREFDGEAPDTDGTSPESEGFFAKVKEFWDGLGR
jgi:molecular chaperone DnaJ